MIGIIISENVDNYGQPPYMVCNVVNFVMVLYYMQLAMVDGSNGFPTKYCIGQTINLGRGQYSSSTFDIPQKSDF